MQWFASAPSNIALIKYMGKDSENNAANPSLSYTLDDLVSQVMLEKHAGDHDYWEPLLIPGANAFALSLPAQQRFLNHLKFLKSQWPDKLGGFIVRSSNNFPHSSGLASSASSFAALTKVSCLAFSELTNTSLPSIETQAQWSALGSGSSCRSFFSPWALWDGKSTVAIDLPYNTLLHQVVLIDQAIKEVSSSEAHQRVKTSPNYAQRPGRARENLNLLVHALNGQDWHSAYKICWREFRDMHGLFTSCTQPFAYITSATEVILLQLSDMWAHHGDGPLVTMDAGPNIHLLYRPDQADMAYEFRQTLLGVHDVL